MANRRVTANGSAQSAKINKLAISERKLRANRENAKKSTGPKTAEGKDFSRRNAVKHGIFVNYATDFEALDENPNEYRDLLQGLWDQYQPVGRAEEIEVERIAVCCWRLKRAWRYENAVNLAARRDFLRAELHEQKEYCDEKLEDEQPVIAQLHRAKKEIVETGCLSAELKQQIFSLMPELEELWLALEQAVQERIEGVDLVKAAWKLSPQRRAAVCDMYSVTRAIYGLENIGRRRWTNVTEIAIGRHAIPSNDSLDRILRYETTIEKYRSRCIEQLDRELVPPTVRVQMT